jgi:penicillin amidase
VKGEADRAIELKFTRHGPVLFVDNDNKRAFAVRSIWFEPGTSAYFGSSDYMTAKDWNGFLTAMRRWGAPSENQVYADTKGNIGWVAAGKTPRRANYDGLMPVPGDGRYEWQGFLSLDDLPKAYQPKQGFLATANQMNLPADYPIAERKVGFEWADSARWQRIVEVLKANDKVTLADAMDLQNDDTAMLARRLVALLQPLSSDDPNVRKGLDLLKPWDARDTADSAAAAVYEVWIANHLGAALLKVTAPKAVDLIAPEASSISAIVAYLESPDAALSANARDAVLRDSLGSAVADVAGKLGADSTTWRWGRLHVAKFDHALMPLADKATASQLSVGPLAFGGAANVPRAATYRRADYQLLAGASFRMVLDVGNWDASRTINTPGQSGDPFSGHYRDLAPLWATGQYVPLLYSRAAVEAATAEAITLTPRADQR